jgi:LmbE family N-acetylglucosaminyl deacetylase
MSTTHQPRRTLIFAPHPDDELLGAGGTLLRRKAAGGHLALALMTHIDAAHGWAAEVVANKESQIKEAAQFIGFDAVHRLDFPSTRLDEVPLRLLVDAVSQVIKNYQPHEVFVPHWADIHSDHRVAFDAVASAVKWFRYPSVERVLAYETLSETEFSLRPDQQFRPNVFIDISDHLDAKLAALQIYSAELGPFPFPRSAEAVRALAMVRGSAAGFHAAEAFELLRERS